MKKYIKPETEILEIQSESHILAGSIQGDEPAPDMNEELGDGVWHAPQRKPASIWSDDEE